MITARRRVLRVRPDQAHRAGSFGLPADGRGTLTSPKTWSRPPWPGSTSLGRRSGGPVPSLPTYGGSSSTPTSTRFAAAAGGESATYPSSPRHPRRPWPSQTASLAARFAPRSLPRRPGCVPPSCCHWLDLVHESGRFHRQARGDAAVQGRHQPARRGHAAAGERAAGHVQRPGRYPEPDLPDRWRAVVIVQAPVSLGWNSAELARFASGV